MIRILVGNVPRKLMFCLVALAFAGCAATPYQRIGNTKDGGYSSTKLSKDTYTVTFQGNENTKNERVYDFALLRSAEITKELGFGYFVVLSDSDQSRMVTRYTPGTPSTSFRTLESGPNGSMYYRTSYSPGMAGGFSSSRNPAYSLRIKVVKSPAEAEAPSSLIHEADAVIARIKAKYAIK